MFAYSLYKGVLHLIYHVWGEQLPESRQLCMLGNKLVMVISNVRSNHYLRHQQYVMQEEQSIGVLTTEVSPVYAILHIL